jgi:histidinol dehydrogenase
MDGEARAGPPRGQRISGVDDRRRRIMETAMPVRLNSRDQSFAADFAALLGQKREASADVDQVVGSVIADVRARGDAALIDLSRKFDDVDLAAKGIAVTSEDVQSAVAQCSEETLDALRFARDRIAHHHLRQVPSNDRYCDGSGVELGHRWTAVESVGLYVPGGLASYPSSVLMNAIPAKVAGVPRIVMVVPSPRGEINPLVLAAADLAGVTEIYRIGGAQAIAALAYGTETVQPVVKIVGPGNAYVAAAKRQVFGAVGIDSIAGPSEVLIIADAKNNSEWIAADLLAQAEHDTAAQSILITDDAAFADAVEAAVARQLKTLSRGAIAGESWNVFGAVIVISSLADAPPLADAIAAEHLEIACAGAEDLAMKIRNAGAIFLGAMTPEVIGDYVSGSNHVLPTARSARFSSGLGVLDFMKRTSILKLDASALAALAPAAMTLARAEGLEAHRRSVEIRLTTTAE